MGDRFVPWSAEEGRADATHRGPAALYPLQKPGREVDADDTEEVIKAGFVTPERTKRAAELLRALGANSYKARQKARKELAEIGMPIPAPLREATKSEDPQIAATAKRLIRTMEAAFGPIRDRLSAAASSERAGQFDTAVVVAADSRSKETP